MQVPISERFLSKVKKTNTCWIWNGYKNKRGYGQYTYDGKNYKAHRFSLLMNGIKLNSNLVVDHLCRNITCVNPKHLEQVTREENLKRKLDASERKINGYCKYGHLLSKDNIYVRCKCCSNKQRKK